MLATMDLVQGEKNRERGRRKRLGQKGYFTALLSP
jgi:hypothetical protein